VKPDDSSVGDGADRFRTTQWSAVLLSAQSQAPDSRAALSDLCKLYWYPLYAFVRRRGCNAEEDLYSQRWRGISSPITFVFGRSDLLRQCRKTGRLRRCREFPRTVL